MVSQSEMEMYKEAYAALPNLLIAHELLVAVWNDFEQYGTISEEVVKKIEKHFREMGKENVE